MKNSFFFFLLLFISVNANSQDIDFFREDLKFTLMKDHFKVQGIYFFRNNKSNLVTTKMIYPFPDESLYGKIDSVTCNQLNDSISTIYKIKDDFMIFSISIPPMESRAYYILYTQELIKNTAMYILSTTSNWGKPFEQANYELEVINLKIDSLSYTPDKVEVFNNSTIFQWKKIDFLPQKNFEVFYQED